jgi:hypothetical protein
MVGPWLLGIHRRDRERPVLRRVTKALTHSDEYPLAQASGYSPRFRLAHHRFRVAMS